jgi:hypothetical protein
MTVKYSKYDEEYFIITRENIDSYPLVCIDEDELSEYKSGGMFASPGPLIQDGYVYPVKLNEPIPESPELVDFHRRPYMFSYRVIKDVAQRHDMPGVQWLPAYIDHNGTRFNDYVIMHVYKKIKCMDMEYSEYDEYDDDAYDIDKLVLDEKVLGSLDLNERLIFKLKEKTSLIFMHESIVNQIMQHNPKGVRFVKSKDWHVGVGFV